MRTENDEMTQIATAMALYLALLAGLALHGLDMPDTISTSSVSNQITDLSVVPDRRDRE
jgi:hypothetical protein